MANFAAPVRDIQFTLEHICDFSELAQLEAYQDATPDLVAALLDGGGKLASGVLAPLNRTGDQQGSVLENGVVRTPEGFKEAYREFVDGGWNGLAFDPAHGGQGLPFTLSVSMMEMITAANMGFALCPMLNLGAMEAMRHHASDALKAVFLDKMVSGEWTSTMNLTEPQAGSDVGALRTRAEPRPDGSYLLSGQKIFITWGDHDMAENIVHLVLARTPDAPPGTKGISLFVVPKFLVNEDGSLSAANDLRCVSLEHKLGIHASPTAVMSYGDNGGCVGYVLGEENKGMRCMFTMMNHARINVGLQGAAIGERAFQRALNYANERRQGRALGSQSPDSSPIVEHADVRRMLMTMKAYTEATRAIIHRNAMAVDLSLSHPDQKERNRQAGIAAFLTPISKGWSTGKGCEVASIGIQVHGGMGFIEETGAAQHYRDIRIAPIYEGTNGIQAQDLVMRKLNLDGGRPARQIIREINTFIDGLPRTGELAAFSRPLKDAVIALEQATAWLSGKLAERPRASLAGATPYLELAGYVIGGYLLSKGAVAARGLMNEAARDRDFYKAKISVARFFVEQLLPRANSLVAAVTGGDDILFALTPEQLSA
ncbi:MAG: acyl-CoA dehydrogenase C-terminal domain-containing protein [Sphingomonadales bacterium]